jgi:ERCC4-related helicase
MLIKHLFNLEIKKRYDQRNKNALGKKVVFLVCEVALVEQQSYVIAQNTPLLVKACSGKNMKSMKKDINTFKSSWASFDIFVATPQVIYQLLSTGYLKISDIDLLIFDECHHTDSNHPYNLLMNEFYFYYKTTCEEKHKNIRLPQILGLTASPLKKKITKDIKDEATKALTQICENLDSMMVLDPEVQNYEESEGSDGIYNLSKDEAERDYIEVSAHTNDPTFIEIKSLLFDYLLIPLTDLCLSNLVEIEYKMFRLEYDLYLRNKFDCINLLQFNKVLSEYKYLYEMRLKSGLINVFEKLQRHLFMVVENLDFDSIFNLLRDYFKILNNFISGIKDENLNLSNSNEISAMMEEYEDFNKKNVKEMVKIIYDCMEKLKKYKLTCTENLYESDRIKSLKIKIDEIIQHDIDFPKEEGHRIIIFVSNRIVAESLSKVVNELLKKFDGQNPNIKKYQAVSVVGVNKKKSENALMPKNSVTLLNENIEKFKNGTAQILIGTSTVEEGLDVKSCDVVMVYTDLRTAKAYIQMKGRARKANAKFLVFTPDRDKTIENIENFVNLTLCMRKLFSDDIEKDFRRKNFLKEKVLDYYHCFFCKTHAKLTLKNVAPLFNEFIQILKANNKSKGVNHKIKFEEERQHVGLGLTTVFKACLSFEGYFNNKSFPNEMCKIESTFYTDKSSAENHCFVVFLIVAYKNKFIDEHFKLQLK